MSMIRVTRAGLTLRMLGNRLLGRSMLYVMIIPNTGGTYITFSGLLRVSEVSKLYVRDLSWTVQHRIIVNRYLQQLNKYMKDTSYIIKRYHTYDDEYLYVLQHTPGTQPISVERKSDNLSYPNSLWNMLRKWWITNGGKGWKS